MNVTATPPAQRYRCPCQHLLQVHGGGRHRRHYQLDDLAWAPPGDDDGLSLLSAPAAWKEPP
jgi:hypothetical protein